MASQALPGRGAGTSDMVGALARPGWLTFAAVVMFAVGVLRLISAIYYFADSTRINNLTLGAFGHHLFLWGLWDLGMAILGIWAAYSLLNGNLFGRVIGYLWAGSVIIESFTMMNWAPWFAFGSLIVALLVIFALSSTSGWSQTESATV